MMRALQLLADREFAVVERGEPPPPGRGEVRLRVRTEHGARCAGDACDFEFVRFWRAKCVPDARCAGLSRVAREARASPRLGWPVSYRRIIVTLTLMRSITTIRGQRARWLCIVSSSDAGRAYSRPASLFSAHDC